MSELLLGGTLHHLTTQQSKWDHWSTIMGWSSARLS